MSDSFATPWTIACEAPLFMGLPRQAYWVSVSFSRGSSWTRDSTCVSCIGRQILYCWATREDNSNYTSHLAPKKAINTLYWGRQILKFKLSPYIQKFLKYIILFDPYNNPLSYRKHILSTSQMWIHLSDTKCNRQPGGSGGKGPQGKDRDGARSPNS